MLFGWTPQPFGRGRVEALDVVADLADDVESVGRRPSSSRVTGKHAGAPRGKDRHDLDDAGCSVPRHGTKTSSLRARAAFLP